MGKMTCTQVDENGKVRDYTLDTVSHKEVEDPKMSQTMEEYISKTRPVQTKDNPPQAKA